MTNSLNERKLSGKTFVWLPRVEPTHRFQRDAQWSLCVCVHVHMCACRALPLGLEREEKSLLSSFSLTSVSFSALLKPLLCLYYSRLSICVCARVCVMVCVLGVHQINRGIYVMNDFC